MKNGGSYSGGAKTASWFSWMDEDYDQKLHTAKEIFEALGFEVSDTSDGGISLDFYDNKTGQEELFVQEVGDLAEEGWYLRWRGEEGALWQDSAAGYQTGQVVYN